MHLLNKIFVLLTFDRSLNFLLNAYCFYHLEKQVLITVMRSMKMTS
jgi:hypothetical protein